MFSQLGAVFAAVLSGPVGTTLGVGCRTLIVTTLIAVSLVGCMQAGGTLVGADPADPSARVAAVGYRSTVAPYTSLRPAPPQAWRQQNERAAPTSKSGE